ncbi:DUF1003 domain-containing protein [Kytococcus schroeteri]|uniref:DUF1003 domain-containing protein n=1 Tax=Kytococcus schroeteri TaxID=138300 RepID=UPI002F266E06
MAADMDREERASRLRELRELRERRARRQAAGEGSTTRPRTAAAKTGTLKTVDRLESSGGLSTPQTSQRRRLPRVGMDSEAFGRASEAFARFMGTPQFLLYMTLFVGAWLAWNTFMPVSAQFDPRELNYTLLTLILSLQASYAAPLILLAQNRQDDRDRVSIEQDRARDERNLADTEYITREVASLRLTVGEMASRDFVRSELRDLLEDLLEELDERQHDREQGEQPDPRDEPDDGRSPSRAGATRHRTYDGGHAHP